MDDKNEENKKIEQWIYRLNIYLPGFVRGDLQSKVLKTADFVNSIEKIAIELKREKGSKLDDKNGNLVTLSNRVEGGIKDSNKKFENYPEYKTMLIFELKTSLFALASVLGGVQQLHFVNGQHVGNSIKNKRLFNNMNNIGAIIFWPAPGNICNKPFYFVNNSAKENCRISKEKAESVLGNTLEILKIY